jgi:hypothetical protein
MLPMPTSLPAPATEERMRLLSMDTIRWRALERLYERRTAVDRLIQSLEDYERSREIRGASIVEISGRRKCS